MSTYDLPDEELLRAIDQGDSNALEMLYNRYSMTVYAIAVRTLRDWHTAEEVTQDVFLRVWNHSSTYRNNKGSVSVWIFTIARHRAIDALRRFVRKEGLWTEFAPDYELVDDQSDPLNYTEAQFRRSKVTNALQILNSDQKTAVLLAYYGGLSHSEIAERLNTPLGTVKARIRSSVRRLREYLGPELKTS